MSWNYLSTTLFNDTQQPGSLTVFFTYDLRAWVFGFRFDPDPQWYDFSVELGPLAFSFNYWRHYPELQRS